MLPGGDRNRGRIVGARSGARVSGKGEHVVVRGTDRQSPARSAPWRAPEPRLRLSGIEFAARERRSSKDARKARQTGTSPRGLGLPDEHWQNRFGAANQSQIRPIQMLAPSSDRPGGAFFASYQGRRPKIRIDCAADDFGPQALAWSGAQRKQRPRETRRSKGPPERDRGQEPPAMNRERALPMRAGPATLPWTRRALDPPTYGCCFGCPILLLDARSPAAVASASHIYAPCLVLP